MTENREWLKGICHKGGMGDFIEPLAAKAVRNAFTGLPTQSALFTGLKNAVVAAVKSGADTLPSDALKTIVAGLDEELRTDTEALTPLATMYKTYAANPPVLTGREVP